MKYKILQLVLSLAQIKYVFISLL